MAVDTTMVCPVTRDGVVQWGWRRKELTYPELTREHGRARLGFKVGGRWSAEASVFLRCLAAAKARGALLWIEGQVRAAWFHRWQGLLGCAAARTFGCADGAIPSVSTVFGEAWYA